MVNFCFLILFVVLILNLRNSGPSRVQIEEWCDLMFVIEKSQHVVLAIQIYTCTETRVFSEEKEALGTQICVRIFHKLSVNIPFSASLCICVKSSRVMSQSYSEGR